MGEDDAFFPDAATKDRDIRTVVDVVQDLATNLHVRILPPALKCEGLDQKHWAAIRELKFISTLTIRCMVDERAPGNTLGFAGKMGTGTRALALACENMGLTHAYGRGRTEITAVDSRACGHNWRNFRAGYTW